MRERGDGQMVFSRLDKKTTFDVWVRVLFPFTKKCQIYS